jgi:hypothetical protein
MKKNLIQPETIKKLQTVAKALYDQHGVDVVNYSNFTSLVRKENDKLDKPMSYLTYTERIAYLSKIIRNLEVDRLKADEKIVAKIEEPKVIEPKEIDFVIIVYKDGSVERKLPKLKAMVEEKEVFEGLFDYHDNLIIIRRGEYSGCNIKSKSSIKAYFKGYTWFETWCQGRLDDVANNKIIPNRNTPRDIETLNLILKQLDERKSDIMI